MPVGTGEGDCVAVGGTVVGGGVVVGGRVVGAAVGMMVGTITALAAEDTIRRHCTTSGRHTDCVTHGLKDTQRNRTRMSHYSTRGSRREHERVNRADRRTRLKMIDRRSRVV